MFVSASARLGEGYVRACAAALAEQLLAAVPVRPDAVVATLLDEDGVLESELSRRLDGGSIIAVHDPHDLAAVEDRTCDAVLSLLTAGFAGAGMLDDTTRVLRPGATAALLVYDGDDPPAHEQVLVAALRAHGVSSAFLEALLPQGFAHAAEAHGFTPSDVRDVARFDGPRHFLQVMVDERPLDADVSASARDDVTAALAAWRAADDTMRIPVHAKLLTASG